MIFILKYTPQKASVLKKKKNYIIATVLKLNRIHKIFKCEPIDFILRFLIHSNYCKSFEKQFQLYAIIDIVE